MTPFAHRKSLLSQELDELFILAKTMRNQDSFIREPRHSLCQKDSSSVPVSSSSPPPCLSNISTSSECLPDFESRVKVVVGGSVFLTTRQTLTQREPNSVFSSQLHSDEKSLSKLENQSQQSSLPSCSDVPELSYSDHNSENFLAILNYLRTGKLDAKHKTDEEIEKLIKEAEIYNCEGLAHQLRYILESRTNKTPFYISQQRPIRSFVIELDRNDFDDDAELQFSFD
eukprot:c11295_g1_i1.p1 GENE.c11295_g1_i1~~c11295_g1_i1.p1  ORF type:complete len:235 (-),score=109.30 c11295_g1_i1:18-701(-)